MKKMSQLCVLLCAITPMAAFSVTPDQTASTNKPSLDALFGDTVIAKGKGVEVKRTDLDAMVVQMKAGLAASQTPAPANLESAGVEKPGHSAVDPFQSHGSGSARRQKPISTNGSPR